MGDVLPATATQLHLHRSESPAFDLHHPEVALSEYEANGADADKLIDAGDNTDRVEELQAHVTDAADNSNEATSLVSQHDDTHFQRRRLKC